MSRTVRVNERTRIAVARSRKRQQKRRDRQNVRLELSSQLGKLPPPKTVIEVIYEELGEQYIEEPFV